ncbi:MAG: hypothetical protein ABJ004_09690 [Cyclobacteriaceae bacterium]
MKNVFSLIVLATLMVSCTPSKKEAEEKPLMDQVMEVHDAVMPKMGSLMKVKKQLMAKADTADSVASDELKILAQEIDLANEAMMDWMRNFDPNFEGTEEEVKDYLMKKKKGIEKVAEAMNSSLEKGENALK